MIYEIEYTTSVVDGAYHGTNLRNGHRIIKTNFALSNHTRDKQQYFGDGVYFWESSFQQALSWAERKAKNGVAVIRATIQLKRCLDLNKSEHIKFVKSACELLEAALQEKLSLGSVINFMHEKGFCAFNTIRGGISEQSPPVFRWGQVCLPEVLMILCVRDIDCIGNKEIAYQRSN